MSIIACKLCSIDFVPRNSRNVYCSKRCLDKGKPSANGVDCCVCGKAMIVSRTTARDGTAAHNSCRSVHGTSSRYSAGCRCAACKSAHNDRLSAYWRSRKLDGRPLPSGGRWISDADRASVYSRDGGICQICFMAVDFDAHYMDDSAPTLDHILPRALGGGDSLPNLRLAHRLCNCARGARVEADQGVSC